MSDLKSLLDGLIASWENETVEFKQAGKDYPASRIGEYFSALANEANLRNMENAWLVFGVNDKSREIVGTNYRLEPEHLHRLKIQISQDAEPSITFANIHCLNDEGERVLLFEIPAAPHGIPIAWKGHYFARAGESIVPMGLDKLDKIRRQTLTQDWTAQIVAEATPADLDKSALIKARQFFAEKYANRVDVKQVMEWPTNTFLERARLTRNRKITRTTLLLLGKAESTWHLSPHPAQLTWKLGGPDRAYEHFTPPFLLATTKLYQRIRNTQLRLMPQEDLLPVEISKYDKKILLEALHNCIAHQDYARNARVVVIEQRNRLVFENEGEFFQGKPMDYLEGNRVPLRYRNPFLSQAMTELNMIDTMGYGIHDIYSRQASRCFPMPDYEIGKAGSVRLTIHGSVINPDYYRVLFQNKGLPLDDILALDRIQKRIPLPNKILTRLKRAGLISGKGANYYFSSAKNSKANSITASGQGNTLHEQLVIDYLMEFRLASRSEIDNLLFDKLTDTLTIKQKRHKIGNLLSKLRQQGVIMNKGSRGQPIWILSEKNPNKKEI